MTPTLWLTGDDAADRLLSSDPFALLVGMLLDQQVTMESAFAGPALIAERMGGLDVAQVAGADPVEFVALCSQSPAIHRYPRSMAGRVQAVAQHLVTEYDGDAAQVWSAPTPQGSEPDGREVLRRLKALPGFGDQKARIFLALLGKQYGAAPDGWREAAGAYGEDGARMSIADVVDQRSLDEVRANKKAAKAAAKAAKAPASPQA